MRLRRNLLRLHAVNTKDPDAVAQEVEAVLRRTFPGAEAAFVRRAFGWVRDCFGGRCPGYQAIDAGYHDLEHTLQGTLCLMRLLGRRHEVGVPPVLSASLFERALLAILLHDTGYLKTTGDSEGTGAKYTLTHVTRSGEFAAQFLAARGYEPAPIQSVQNMIRCTGVNADLQAIPFADDAERIAGYALGTADLLGQMAADDYLEKLPELHQEFTEAVRFNPGRALPSISFPSAEELMRSTPGFWERYVWPKINQDFRGLYRFLNDPYPDGPNWYVQQVEANLARLRLRLAA